MKALLLCAGLGTRLRPLTESYAKPALPILGIPTVWYPAWSLQRQLGLREMAVNVGHAPKTLSDALNAPDLQEAFPTKFHVSDESGEILGSSGALWKLSSWIGRDRVLGVNGDSIFLPNWKRLLEFHEEKKAAMTLHVRSFSEGKYSGIQLDSQGRVLEIGPKAQSGVMFSGAYVLESGELARIPAGVSEIHATLWKPLIEEGKLFAFQENLPWFDTGSPTSFAQTQFQLLEHIPQFRDLVEVRMCEVSRGAWLPGDWPSRHPKLIGPGSLVGDPAAWLRAGSAFGPRVIGIEAPASGSAAPVKNAILLNETVVPI